MEEDGEKVLDRGTVGSAFRMGCRLTRTCAQRAWDDS